METKQQAKNYDLIADHWNGEQFNRNNGIEQHKRALRFVKNGQSAIDIGCGSSGRILDLLLEQGFDAEGFDFSEEMLKLARQRHPELTFHHADICVWDFPKTYDFISAWDSVWHAPLNQQESILRKLCGALNPHGVLIYTSGAVDEMGEGDSDFLGQVLHHAALGTTKILDIVASSGCACRHLENDDWPNKHLYLIIQRIGN